MERKGLGDETGCHLLPVQLAHPMECSDFEPQDPRALQEIDGTGKGPSLLPASPRSEGLEGSLELRPLFWPHTLMAPEPHAHGLLFWKKMGVDASWADAGAPSISSGALAVFLRSLILSVLICFGDINSTY